SEAHGQCRLWWHRVYVSSPWVFSSDLAGGLPALFADRRERSGQARSQLWANALDGEHGAVSWECRQAIPNPRYPASLLRNGGEKDPNVSDARAPKTTGVFRTG